MKRLVSIMIVVVASIATAFGQEIKTKAFDLADYDRIEVESAIDVKLVANGTEGVSVECDERLIPAIKVVQNGHKVSIGLDWKVLRKITGRRWSQSININNNKLKINGMSFKGQLKVTANIKQIKEIKTSSSGDVEWSGTLPTNELHLIASSSGDIEWTGLLTVDKLYIDCSSSGDVKGDYKGQEAFVELDSSGDYKGDMEVGNLEVEVSSSGDFVGKVTANKAVFDLNSSGDAKVRGTIDSLYVDTSSSGDFMGRKISYKYARVKTSSSGNIYLSKSGEVRDMTPRRSGLVIE